MGQQVSNIKLIMTTTPKKLIALNFEREIHHLDHIGVISAILDIPLLVSSKIEETLGQKYYPGLKIFQVPDPIKALKSDDYDIVFSSYFANKKLFKKFAESFEKKFHKTIKSFFCPHGFSDKSYHFKKCIDQDYLLVYGQSMSDMFKEMGLFDALPPYVISGNYRYEYYLQHKAFYQEMIRHDVLSFFKDKFPCVLYAPTWRDKQTDTSFFDVAETLIDHLPDRYNLIIKPHPRLEDNDPENYSRIVTKYEHKENVLFLANYPLIYPLLDCIDICISDTSSIGYDFLVFNKPLYFLNHLKVVKKKDRRNRLQTGVVIQRKEYERIWNIIEDTLPSSNLFSQVRQETYRYVFGNKKPLPEVKSDILHMLDQVR